LHWKSIKWVLLGVIALFLIGYFSLFFWLSHNIKSILNQDPDRAYNIDFERVELSYFFKSLELDDLRITPVKQTSTNTLSCWVDYATMDGLVWKDLVFGRTLKIEKLGFVNPIIYLKLGQDTTQVKQNQRNPVRGVQQLFSDVLSRGELENFRIYNGQIQAHRKADTIFRLENLNLLADDLEIDSVQLTHLIPFSMKDFTFSFEKLQMKVDTLQKLSLGSFQFTLRPSQLVLEEISLTYMQNLLTVSKVVGVQKDLIDLKIDVFQLNQIELRDRATGEWDIRAHSGNIENLELKDFRNKNLPKSPEYVKPFLMDIFNKTPVPFKIDTITVKNANIIYSELPPVSQSPGSLKFLNSYVSAYHITNIPRLQQQYGTCEIDIISKVNGKGNLQGRLVIPYDLGGFQLSVRIDSFDLVNLNQSVVPLANVSVESGRLHLLDFQMDATRVASNNILEMHYDNLKISVMGEEKNKKGMISLVANSLVRKQNLPGKKKYRTAQYTSERNLHKGPFNFIWNSLKMGFIEILPAATVKKKARKAMEKQK